MPIGRVLGPLDLVLAEWDCWMRGQWCPGGRGAGTFAGQSVERLDFGVQGSGVGVIHVPSQLTPRYLSNMGHKIPA